jgi:hypothetical protein
MTTASFWSHAPTAEAALCVGVLLAWVVSWGRR